MKWMSEKQHIWKYVKLTFHVASLPFHGLSLDNSMKVKDPKKIVEIAADYYKKHFEALKMDRNTGWLKSFESKNERMCIF